VTLTAQTQPAGAFTVKTCDPTDDAVEIDCPEAPVSVTAGVADGLPPAGPTNTWNEGPETGAGVHSNAQPMFHGAAVVVNEGLVQSPFIWVAGSSNCNGVPGAVVGVEVGAVVGVTPPGTVVAVVAPLGPVEAPWGVDVFEVPGGSVVVGAAVPVAAGGGSASSWLLVTAVEPL